MATETVENPADDTPDGPDKGTILVIDDDPSTFEALQDAGLTEWFDLVRVPGDADVALAVTRHNPRAVFVDAERAPDLSWLPALLVGTDALFVGVGPQEALDQPALRNLGLALHTTRPVETRWLTRTLWPKLGLRPTIRARTDSPPPPPPAAFGRPSLQLPTLIDLELDLHDGEPGFDEPLDAEEVTDAAKVAPRVEDSGDDAEWRDAAPAVHSRHLAIEELAAALAQTREERDATVEALMLELAEREEAARTVEALFRDALERHAIETADAKVQRDLMVSLRDDLLTSHEAQSDAIEQVRKQYESALEEQLAAWDTEREETLEKLATREQELAEALAQLATAPRGPAEALAATQTTELPSAATAPMSAETATATAEPGSLLIQAALEEATRERDAAAADCARLQSELGDVSMRWRAAQTALVEAQAAEQAQRERVFALEQDNERLAQRIEEARAQAETARQEARDLRLAASRTDEELLGARTELSALQAALEAKEQTVAQAQAREAELVATLGAAETRLREMFASTQQSRSLEDRVAELEDALVQAASRASELVHRAEAAESHLAEREQAVERFRDAAAARARENDALRKKLDEAPTAGESADELRDKLAATRQALTRAEAAVREEVTRWQRTESERQRLAQELAAARLKAPPPLPSEQTEADNARIQKLLEQTTRQRAEWTAERTRLLTEIGGLRAQLGVGTAAPPSAASPQLSVAAADSVDKLREEVRAATQSIRMCLLEIEHGRQRIDAHRQQLLQRKAAFRALVELFKQLDREWRQDASGPAAELAARLRDVVEQMRGPLRETRSLVDGAETLTAAQEALVQRLYGALTRRP
jgi:hypothetical protein